MLLPLGRRRNRYDRKVVAAYQAGTLSGALTTTLAVWILSGFAEPVGASDRAALLVAGAMLAWAIKHGPLVGMVALPENQRQIPTSVFAGSLLKGAYQFGFEMGTGMRTYVPSFAPYVLLLTLFAARPTLLQALLVAVGFGVGRAIPLMIHLRPEDQELMTRDFLQGNDYRLAQTVTGVVVLVGGLLLV